MDDLISREAVLALPIYNEKNLYGNIIREYVDIEDVKQLPPAQPEIVRCEECLYRKICSWEKQGAKFCSFAERREVTT